MLFKTGFESGGVDRPLLLISFFFCLSTTIIKKQKKKNIANKKSFFIHKRCFKLHLKNYARRYNRTFSQKKKTDAREHLNVETEVMAFVDLLFMTKWFNDTIKYL
jgi:hypothetical protein